MAFDEGLADRIREVLSGEPGLTGKKMFGGYGFLLDGNMCAGVQGDRLIVRVPADEHEAILDRTGRRSVPQSGSPDERLGHRRPGRRRRG